MREHLPSLFQKKPLISPTFTSKAKNVIGEVIALDWGGWVCGGGGGGGGWV